jgi:glycosyltransferase involved in cell wall biosynthesis
MRRIEVILVDDGSTERVADIINADSYSFEVKIVRLEHNLGLSNARNVGASLSRNPYLVFIDSDILLSKNYLYEHNVRLQSLPDAIFLSLKQNILATNDITDLNAIKRGLDVPTSYNDKRLFREQKRNTPWVNKISSDGAYEILSETNYLTSFGNGRMINGFDLPSAVIGHNMSMRREVYNRAGGFPASFTGWGLEDTLFGATAIAQGCFVIPVLSCGVYHIDHPVRQVTEHAKKAQYLTNIKKYKKLLEQQL